MTTPMRHTATVAALVLYGLAGSVVPPPTLRAVALFVGAHVFLRST